MSTSRIFATALRSARLAPRRTSIPYIPRYQRSFSITPSRRASEDTGLAEFQAAFQKTTLFKKLADHPEAISALEDLGRALSQAGVDLSGGKQPSAFQMMKLAAKSDFRAAVTRVAEEMKKAGVDFSSKEVMDEVMNLKKFTPPPQK